MLSPRSTFTCSLSVRRASSRTRTREAFTFRDASFRRAVSLGDVLHGNAEMLRSSSSTSDTYAFSQEVDYIDAFLSHNWVNSGITKGYTLCIYFNLYLALSTTIVFEIFLLWFQSSGVIPGVLAVTLDGVPRFRGVGAQLGTPLCSIMLLFGHEIQKKIWFHMPWVFLDKCCIHQTDQVLKREGIMSLAAFLKYSRQMIILYTDTYLKKLWTVYELASFIVLHPVNDIVVLPLYLPKMYASISAALFFIVLFSEYIRLWIVVQAVRHIVPAHVVAIGVTLILIISGFYAFCTFCSWYNREQARYLAEVASFSITRASCSDENDRPMVYDNIEAFMKQLKYVATSATQEEALQEFDELVHRELPTVIKASTGKNGVPYWFTSLVALNLGLVYVNVAGGYLHRGEVLAAYLQLHLGLFMQLAVIPLAMAYCWFAMSYYVPNTRVTQDLYKFFVSISGLIIIGGMGICADVLTLLATSSNSSQSASRAALFIFHGMTCTAFLLVYRLYRRDSSERSMGRVLTPEFELAQTSSL